MQDLKVSNLLSEEVLGEPMLTRSREKILTVLKYEPFLTTKQVARMFYSTNREGLPSRVFSIRPRKHQAYDLEPGYFSAYRILKRMEKDGILKRHKPDFRGNPDLWSLPGKKQPINWYSRKHEIDCGDVFASLSVTGRLVHWDDGWALDEEHAKHRVNYDRRAEIEGVRHVVFFEVDRGTEDLETIRKKVEKYENIRSRDSFCVIFTVQGYRWTSEKERAEEISKVLRRFNKAKQYLVTLHSAFLVDPLGSVLVCPHVRDRSYSLAEV